MKKNNLNATRTMLHSRYSKRTIWWSWQEAEGKGQNSRNSEEE